MGMQQQWKSQFAKRKLHVKKNPHYNHLFIIFCKKKSVLSLTIPISDGFTVS
jgi:hypothetical protein